MARRPFERARLGIAAAGALVVALAVVALRAGAGDGGAPAPAQAAPQPTAAPLASVPPIPAPAAAAAPVAASTRTEPSPAEDRQMAELRAQVDTNPSAAVALAEEGDRRDPSGPYAEERAWLRMRALVHLGEIGIARDGARRFYEEHPGSPLARYVFRLTGMRPMPPLGPPR